MSVGNTDDRPLDEGENATRVIMYYNIVMIDI